MLVLRVRCVDDGRELLLERHGANAYSIQVAELKQLILQQRQQIYRSGSVAITSNPQSSDPEDWFVLLRGQILADPDAVDLNALDPSDFFVFAPDAPQPEGDSSSSSEMHNDGANFASFGVLRAQLVDMGFSAELAAHALRQSRSNLSDAAALLTDGKVHAKPDNDGSMSNEKKEGDLVTQNPSIAPLRSLVHDNNVRKLRELAAVDSFQALLLLKEQFSTEVLNRLNENPVATLRLLSLPAPTRSQTTAEWGDHGLSGDEIIEITEADYTATRVAGGSDGPIDRLAAMGFARDLVEVMYESCGGDEQLTANALLQTLGS